MRALLTPMAYLVRAVHGSQGVANLDANLDTIAPSIGVIKSTTWTPTLAAELPNLANLDIPLSSVEGGSMIVSASGYIRYIVSGVSGYIVDVPVPGYNQQRSVLYARSVFRPAGAFDQLDDMRHTVSLLSTGNLLRISLAASLDPTTEYNFNCSYFILEF